jgi:hypothetical protein
MPFRYQKRIFPSHCNHQNTLAGVHTNIQSFSNSAKRPRSARPPKGPPLRREHPLRAGRNVRLPSTQVLPRQQPHPLQHPRHANGRRPSPPRVQLPPGQIQRCDSHRSADTTTQGHLKERHSRGTSPPY